MFNGLTFEKLLLVGVVAVFLVGPDRLPHYAAQLARLVRTLRGYADGAKTRMKEEMGPEFDEVDWKKLDPRQYDPRRIIREALLDDGDQTASPAIVSPSSRKQEQASVTVAGMAALQVPPPDATVDVTAVSTAPKPAEARAIAPFDVEST